MIPIQLQPEPPHFLERVQQPGHNFLAKRQNMIETIRDSMRF